MLVWGFGVWVWDCVGVGVGLEFYPTLIQLEFFPFPTHAYARRSRYVAGSQVWESRFPLYPLFSE